MAIPPITLLGTFAQNIVLRVSASLREPFSHTRVYGDNFDNFDNFDRAVRARTRRGVNFVNFRPVQARTEIGSHERYTAGGAEGNRTPDLCSAIAALSHLSYSPAPSLGRRARWDRAAEGGSTSRDSNPLQSLVPAARRPIALPRRTGPRQGTASIQQSFFIATGRLFRPAALEDNHGI